MFLKENQELRELIVPERHIFYFLVVDGNVDDRFKTNMILQRFGYHICTANSTGEAIELMKIVPPAAIIADAGSVMDLTLWTRKDSRYSGVPIIVLDKAPVLKLLVQQEKFAACITKPLNVEKLYRAVQSAIEKTPRENVRIETCFLAKMGGQADGKKGIITVLSEAGMFIQTDDPQPVNARFPVSFEINGRIIQLEALVLYTYSLESSPLREPGMGMRFIQASPEDQSFIKAYILGHIEDGIVRLDR